MNNKEIERNKIKQHWKKIFEDYIESKMPIKAYCRENKISRDRFRYWKEQLEWDGFKFKSPYAATHEATKKVNDNFIVFNLNDITRAEISKTLQIKLSSLTINIDPNTNKYFIKKLIKELEGII